MNKPKVKKEKDFTQEKVGESQPETEESISREDILTYMESLSAQMQEYDLTVRSPIDLRLTVIRSLLDILSTPYVHLTTSISQPMVDEGVRKDATALMQKLIKQIDKMFEEEKE